MENEIYITVSNNWSSKAETPRYLLEQSLKSTRHLSGLSLRSRRILYGGRVIRGSHALIRDSHALIRGSHALIRGSHALIRGSHALIRGSHALIRGSHALIRGSHTLIRGSHALIRKGVCNRHWLWTHFRKFRRYSERNAGPSDRAV